MLSAYGIALGVRQRLYPYQAAIRSALGIADEYCIVYDKRFDDADIFSDIDPRVQPVEHYYDFNEWDFINTALTKARRSCSGDWCLYLEMDEVLHEKDFSKYTKALQQVQESNAAAIAVRYLDMIQNYIRVIGSRQKITKNISEIYHKTSPYMIGKCNSGVWDGNYILPGFDDVSYYDERKKAWFNDPCAYDLNNDTFVWHYSFYSLARKFEQGRQNRMWQDRTYGRSLDYDVLEVERSFQEQIVIADIDMTQHIDYCLANGYVKAGLSHPCFVKEWLEQIDKNY